MKHQEAKNAPLLFRIGAVSRQTGVPTETLRAWERRYNVVEPQREGGHSRLYSQEDIDRLSLIKQLVDSGFAIGTIAHLSMAELQDKIPANSPSLFKIKAGEELDVVIIGSTLKAIYECSDTEFSAPLQLGQMFASQEEFEAQRDQVKAKIFVLELPTIHTSSAFELRRWIQDMGLPICIINYQFASREAETLMSQGGLKLLKGTQSISQLQSIISNLVQSGEVAKYNEEEFAQKYSREQLVKISSMSNSVKCECPRHLADLVLGLDSFARYSLECQNRNEDDANLHAGLYLATTEAQKIMEEALRNLIEIEGLEV